MGWYYESCGHGMGFNGQKDGDEYKVDFLAWSDQALSKQVAAWRGGKKFDVGDSNEKQSIRRVVWFIFT